AGALREAGAQSAVRRLSDPSGLPRAGGRGNEEVAMSQNSARKLHAHATATKEVPPRFEGIIRNYSPGDVNRLRGSVRVEHTLAELGAAKLWALLHSEDYVAALGALT